MANRIKYNSGIDAESLNVGNWSIGLFGAGGGPTSATDFYSGIDPQYGYTIYANGISARVAADDAELIYLINSMGDNSSTIEGSFNFAKNNDILIIKTNYDNPTTDGLVAYFDPSKPTSYPGYTTMYSLNNGNTMTVSDPNLISNGVFSFDGTAHGQTINTYLSLNADAPNTLEVVFKMNEVPGSDQAVVTDNWGPEYGIWALTNGRIGYAAYGMYNNVDSTFTPGKWHHAVMTMDPGARNSGATDQTELAAFFDGQMIAENIMYSTGNGMNDQPFTIGYDYKGGSPSAYMNGDVAHVRFYNRRLGADEVSRNYYGGHIVTEGLVTRYDAGKLVSYDSVFDGSTVTTSMVNDITGTLTGGVSHTKLGGGTWQFDGINDYIESNKTVPYIAGSDFTFAAWVKGFPQDHKSVMSLNNSGGGNRALWMQRSTGGMGLYDGGTWFYGTQDIADDQWHHVVLTYNVSARRAIIYTDSNVTMDAVTNNTINVLANDTLSIGMEYDGASTTDHFSGWIATASVYNRCLTPVEVSQNYTALASRFR